MLKIWRDLEKKFFTGGAVNPTARYTRMIAMMIFWWISRDLETRSRQRAFRAFFDIEESDFKKQKDDSV